jgi:hypothetical protein
LMATSLIIQLALIRGVNASRSLVIANLKNL